MRFYCIDRTKDFGKDWMETHVLSKFLSGNFIFIFVVIS